MHSLNGIDKFRLNMDELYLQDGYSCNHSCCSNHFTHPCEGCGRISGVCVKDHAELAKEARIRAIQTAKDIFIS